ncbi:MAG TPA: malto-oligosyltrehalose synthase [Trebonia sp.]|nr:malto-oligosyltrehalose synthase [Trebonia sp.]
MAARQGREPVSTYRLQLTRDFGFAAAAELAGYLGDLGVTHVYLSPILQATPGSGHGYDVTDHSMVRPELGGEPGFRAMAAELKDHGIGIVVDIVPNHMAIPAPESLNRPLWSVLQQGRESPYAHWFDIDWAVHENRMLLPILAGPPEECLHDLTVEPDGPDGVPVLRYFDHMLPLWPGTARLPMVGLLESQHYKLADWRTESTELNWRRFFDITSLIAIRVEDPDVFNATHEVILRLVADGLIDGLRVDHPDGLADPRGYFRRLAEATGEMWVVAEKILEFSEHLPADWPVAGTTGYDSMYLVGGLFVNSDGAAPLMDQYRRFAGQEDGEQVAPDFASVAKAAKREIAWGSFGSEIARLVRLAESELGIEADGDAEAGDTHRVLAELAAGFEVYRAYTYPGEPPTAEAEAAIDAALAAAREQLPERLYARAEQLAAAALSASAPEFATRFQQTTGPVLARGIEDTAYYRWPRLISRNEVGGDPDRFAVTPAEFHEAAARLQRDWPLTMTTMSTHDTKRQEDTRARLSVLAEMTTEWAETVTRWHDRAVSPPVHGDSTHVIDADTEYFLWQTFVCAWPLSGYRLTGYLTKAIREAKVRTSWTEPDPVYEAAVLGLATRVLADAELARDIKRFVDKISPDAMISSLGSKLVQLTMPGVADVYQGCELGGLSLVDPDNRRPVDYRRRRELLTTLDEGRLDLALRDARKLLVTTSALRLRRKHPDWFIGPEASYTPLTAEGQARDHVVAFARSNNAVTVATRLPVTLRAAGGWGDTTLSIPDNEAGWRCALTGTHYEGGTTTLDDLCARLPVTLLERQ